jgi:hypothetical protein
MTKGSPTAVSKAVFAGTHAQVVKAITERKQLRTKTAETIGAWDK